MQEIVNRYKIVIRRVPIEDGGGFHVFAPTLGALTVYGVGDDLEEAIQGYADAVIGVGKIFESEGLSLPKPTAEDAKWAERLRVASDLYGGVSGEDERAANNNYAFTA